MSKRATQTDFVLDRYTLDRLVPVDTARAMVRKVARANYLAGKYGCCQVRYDDVRYVVCSGGVYRQDMLAGDGRVIRERRICG